MNAPITITRTLLDTILEIAQQASERILEVYEGNFVVQRKADQSPLTAADLAANEAITSGLSQLAPRLPVLSEESALFTYSERARWEQYWLVDPLDGTREFVKRNDEFTVNIALIDHHRPVLGVIQAPVTGVQFFAAHGIGAFKAEPGQQPQSIQVRHRLEGRLRVAGSRSHRNPLTNAFISNLGDTEIITIGSSLKSCLVAEGSADIYPRFGATSEWDTAAAQCVVEAAGGQVTDTALLPLRYNTKESLTNPPFLVFGDTSQDWRRFVPAME